MSLLDTEGLPPAVDAADLKYYVRDQRRTLPGLWFWIVVEAAFHGNWRLPRPVTREFLRGKMVTALGVPEPLRSAALRHASIRQAIAFVQQAFVAGGYVVEDGTSITLTTEGLQLAQAWYVLGWDSWCRNAELIRRKIDK